MRNCYVHFRSELLQLLILNSCFSVWIFTRIIQTTQRTLLITLTPNRDTSLSLPRLFSSIRTVLTLHGTKSNSVLSLDELAGEAARLDCIWGMLILQESGSGDVMIKDSISQRSVWCDHILPLTDGVSLMVCLSQVAASAPVEERAGCFCGVQYSSHSLELYSVTDFLSSCVILSICIFIYFYLFCHSLPKVLKDALCLSQHWNTDFQLIFLYHEALSCIIPTCVSVECILEQQVLMHSCCALLLSNSDDTNANISRSDKLQTARNRNFNFSILVY